MKILNFRGDVTDNLAKKEALVTLSNFWPLERQLWRQLARKLRSNGWGIGRIKAVVVIYAKEENNVRSVCEIIEAI